MLSKENFRSHQVEVDEDYLESRKEAAEIADHPFERIDPTKVISTCITYGGRDSFFLELVTQKDDEEQLDNMITILQCSSSYIFLPDSIDLAGFDLIEKKDYSGWWDVLYALKYVPLQISFLYGLKRHEDYVAVLDCINIDRLEYRKTFLMALLVNWFEWMVKSGTNLWSYEDKRQIYQDNAVAIALKAEAKPIREEWFRLMPQRIADILQRFAKLMPAEMMMEWACGQPLQNDRLQNDYGEVHDQCLRQIWALLSGMVDLKSMAPKQRNLNFLMLLCDEVLVDPNADQAMSLYTLLKERLLKENFANMGNRSIVDEERQRKLLKLVKLLYPDLKADEIINEVTIKADGWNVDFDDAYDEARREAYIVCCLLRRFEAYDKSDQEQFDDWKLLIDTFMRDYCRCDNEYIANDEFAIPLRLAVEVAEKQQNESCREYLHKALIDNVLSIVSLLTIFFSCNHSMSNTSVKALLDRIEEEWPSASVLMDVRNQKRNREIIEKNIEYLRKFDTISSST